MSVERTDLPAQFGRGLIRALTARRLSGRLALGLAFAGPVLATITFILLNRAADGLVDPRWVRLAFLADLVFMMALGGLIAWRIGGIVLARRARSAGSRLHLRLTGVFTVIAVAPAVVVAIFSTITVNFGMEAWFSNQVRTVVRNSLETAQAYAREHQQSIRGDVLAMANDLNRSATGIDVNWDRVEEIVRRQAAIREMPEAYVVNSNLRILARGEFSFLFSFDPPSDEALSHARAGQMIIIADDANNEIRALVSLTNFPDAFLYVTRRVDGEVLRLLDETRDAVALYERLETERGDVLFDFALLYLGFALLVTMAAIWMGLWFAERISRPIGRLAGAAQRVGAGDFSARVKEESGDDEIAVLSRVFNWMANQVKRQRDDLIEVNEETERRRLFIEAVLSGVTAGVIGLDRNGQIELINDSAAEMLQVGQGPSIGRPLIEVAPFFATLLEEATRSPSGVAQHQVAASIGHEDREFLSRVAIRQGLRDVEGFVLTFDDMTDLTAAQRMAAWGDVARRIAHEIKNPLTPIQLSAERLRRKYAKDLSEADQATFNQYADVIQRQAGDIRRMVDEFSKFARMPEPELHEEDLVQILRDAVFLQQSARTDVTYSADLPDDPVLMRCDRGMMSQAMTNLLQNAADAIESRLGNSADETARQGEIRVRMQVEGDEVQIFIADNGIGLPEKGRSRLLEPYVTTRQKGTGLGLAIVKKIVETHRGSVSLRDAESFADGAKPGAEAVVRLTLPKAPGIDANKEAGDAAK